MNGSGRYDPSRTRIPSLFVAEVVAHHASAVVGLAEKFVHDLLGPPPDDLYSGLVRIDVYVPDALSTDAGCLGDEFDQFLLIDPIV